MGNASRILQHLYSLNNPSPDLLRHLLHCLIKHDEEENYLTDLKKPELKRMLDFLLNALGLIPINDAVAQEGLKKLQAICANRWTFPPSYSPSGLIGPLSESRTTAAGFDLWDGIYYKTGSIYDRKNIYIADFRDPVGYEKKMLFDLVFSLRRLSHPNIIPIISAAVNPVGVVMELMPDRNPMEYLEEHPEANRLSLLLDVAEGLNYLQTNKLVGMPAIGRNVIVDDEGRARLMSVKYPRAVRRNMSEAPLLILPEAAMESAVPPSTNASCFGIFVIEVFAGGSPFSESAVRDIISKITDDGIRPDLPEGAQELGLTESLWEMTVRCLGKGPAQQPNMTEVVGLLRELLMSSLSMEADLRDFFEVCKTQGGGGQRGRAQEFADELDEALDSTGLRQEKQKKYLRYLQKLCSAFDLLPFSFLLPQQSVKLAAAPFDSGGYSTVFKATFNERPIVVKVLNIAAQAERTRLHRYLVKEVVGWKWLRHENILPFVGVIFTPSAPISIASEFMENGNIMDFIRKNQDYNRVELLVGAVTGLEYLHEDGIVHGDLKGLNILIDSQHRARLADFGLSTIVNESTRGTATDADKSKGTTRWMAPELLHPEKFGFIKGFGGRVVSKNTDIYAIGMTIFEVITGCVPFASDLRNETVILKVMKGDRPDRPPSGLSETLWNLLVAMWVEQYAQKPCERPSASTVLTRLKECVDDWGKSIIPLIPEDWENTDDEGSPTTMTSLFSDLNFTPQP